MNNFLVNGFPTHTPLIPYSLYQWISYLNPTYSLLIVFIDFLLNSLNIIYAWKFKSKIQMHLLMNALEVC